MWVKICGVTSLEDARAAAMAGADALGLNFAAGSPRALGLATAQALCEMLARDFPEVERVGVVVNEPGGAQALLALRARVGLSSLQLHGEEPPELAQALSMAQVPVIRALRLAREDRLEAISRQIDLYHEVTRLGAPCRILVDARVEGAHGGTGARVDPVLLRALVGRRPVLVAGGLRAENVAQVTALGAGVLGVDTASGVESAPGIKNHEAMRAFVKAARGAAVAHRSS